MFFIERRREWKGPSVFPDPKPNDNLFRSLAVVTTFDRVLLFVLQWADKDAYKETPLKLADLLKSNFEAFTDHRIGEDNKLTEEILSAGPIY